MKTLLKVFSFFTLVFVVGWLVFSRDVLHPSLEDMIPQQRSDSVKEKSLSDRMSEYWKSANITAKNIPSTTALVQSNVAVTKGVIEVMTLNTFYRKAEPPQNVVPLNKSILFLHGKKFQSKNWEELGTLQLMAALGYVTAAIDLPGFGKTGDQQFLGNKAMFVASTIESLSLHNVVLVSPSMSGTYSMSFLDTYPESLMGFLPVAAVASHSVSKSRLQQITVPTLLVYGDGDTTGLAQQSRSSLNALPYFLEYKVKDAGHAAYLDQPDIFHKLLYNFMELLNTQPRPEGPITWRNWKTWKRQNLLSRIQ